MCKNPDCIAKARAWMEGTKQLEFARSIHLASLKGYRFRLNAHSQKRQLERAISRSELIAIIKNGEIVHQRIVGKYSRSIILGYLATQGGPRPLHAVLEYRHDEQFVEVITLYDPRTKKMWSPDFKTKICFCEQE